MNHSMPRHLILDSLPVTLSVAVVCAWGVDLLSGPFSGPVRVALLVLFLVLACLVVGLVCYKVLSAQRAMCRQFEMLFQMEPHNLANGLTGETLQNLRKNNPWREVFELVRQRIISSNERLQVAERARAKAEVRARNLNIRCEQLDEILAGLAEPVVAIDQFDELVMANPSAKRLFDVSAGRTEERALGRLEQCEELIALLTETRRRKSPTQRMAEFELEDTTGMRNWYSVTTRSIPTGGDAPDENDSPHGAVAVLRDISTQKILQKRNAEFVSAVSHEMKTPLAGIKAYVELLVDGDAEDEETREEFLRVINGQADRLQRLIDNLLNLARIEAGVVSVSKDQRSLNEVLEEAVSVVQPAAEKKNIRLVSDLSEMYLDVLIDRDMVLQAAINLLSNAIKYTPRSGTIYMRGRAEQEQLILEVADSGPGIPPEERKQVFEAFYTGKAPSGHIKGTGIGLSVVMEFVTAHGGLIEIVDGEWPGAHFRIRMPLKTTTTTEEPVPAGTGQAGSRAHAA